jgi:hypothetical protein
MAAIDRHQTPLPASPYLLAHHGLGREEIVMKALVYNGPGKKVVEERPKPELSAPTDAIVKLEDDDLRE